MGIISEVAREAGYEEAAAVVWKACNEEENEEFKKKLADLAREIEKLQAY